MTTTIDEPSVCVEDFCGYTSPGHFPCTFSADFFPRLGVTKFSGEWCDVSDMPSAKVPTLRQVHKWAQKHGAKI